MDYATRTFPLGWVPDMDEVNGPEGGLLRGDNLVTDELGVLALRLGSSKINAGAFADTDIHSLFTVVRSGTRYRYTGANSAVYRNDASIISGINGSDDIFFGSHMGQTLIARGTTKRKDDGSTVRNLGIAMTGAAPAVQAVLAPNTKQFATWYLAETANHVMVEDDGSGLTYDQDHAGVANQGAVVKANNTTLKGIIQRTYAADTDFANYGGPVAGADSDMISTYVLVHNSTVAIAVTMFIDVNDGTYQQDYYYKRWVVGGTSVPGALTPGGGEVAPNDPGSDPSNPPLI